MGVYWLLYFTRTLPAAPHDGPLSVIEPAFVVADAVLSLTLVAAGRALLAGRRPAGAFLLAAGAAMCLYLGVLDLMLQARHGPTAPVALAVAWLSAAGGAVALRFAWVLWRDG